MTDNPRQYEWNGTTVQEADALLSAAQELINAHMKALVPGEPLVRYRLAKTARVRIKVSLDLTELADSASEVQALNAAFNHETNY
ncbi:hypothetical protein AB0F30_16900 [Streptomyces sp. NPDC029006]|uniref:hypothetical protein n=1 Tax=Streptomyces sp. NPDC029006 TaxID=3155467 RepID=UPI0033E44FE1